MQGFDPVLFVVIFDELLGRVGLLASAVLGLVVLVAGAIGLYRLSRAGRLGRLKAPLAIGLLVGLAVALALPALTHGMIARVRGVDFAILAVAASGAAAAAFLAAAAVMGFRVRGAAKRT